MTSPGTRKRGVRIPDVLWAEYQEACTVAGVNASEQVRRLISEWVAARTFSIDGAGEGSEPAPLLER